MRFDLVRPFGPLWGMGNEITVVSLASRTTNGLIKQEALASQLVCGFLFVQTFQVPAARLAYATLPIHNAMQNGVWNVGNRSERPFVQICSSSQRHGCIANMSFSSVSRS
jgi:hypothetical protein